MLKDMESNEGKIYKAYYLLIDFKLLFNFKLLPNLWQTEVIQSMLLFMYPKNKLFSNF